MDISKTTNQLPFLQANNDNASAALENILESTPSDQLTLRECLREIGICVLVVSGIAVIDYLILRKHYDASHTLLATGVSISILFVYSLLYQSQTGEVCTEANRNIMWDVFREVAMFLSVLAIIIKIDLWIIKPRPGFLHVLLAVTVNLPILVSYSILHDIASRDRDAPEIFRINDTRIAVLVDPEEKHLKDGLDLEAEA